MTAPWWLAVTPARTSVECDGEEHRIDWAAGRLLLRSHPDLAAERALAALGGDVPHCVFVRQCWDAYVTDPTLVTLGRRPRDDHVGFADVDLAAALADARDPRGRRHGEQMQRRAELTMLLSLPPAFVDRLVITAMAQTAEAWRDPDYREVHGLRLGAALSARAAPALRRFGARVRTPEGAVHVHCAPAQGTTDIRAEWDGNRVQVTAALPLEWLPSVWGAGISEPDGTFVLRVTGGEHVRIEVELGSWRQLDDRTWEAVAERAELVRDAEGTWRVAGRPG